MINRLKTSAMVFLSLLLLASSSLASNVVQLNPEYFPNPTIGRALSGAQIYVGVVDLDPEVEANQIQLSVLQENGTTVDVAQPLFTGAGGVPLYNGSPVTMLVDGSYSLKILDSVGSQIYYIPKNAELESITSIVNIADLRAITTTPANGDIFTVLGYYAEGDGGGGQFYWDATSIETDNGGTIIKVATITTGRWIRSESLHGNVLFFGTKGDGVTDDTTAINACLLLYEETTFPGDRTYMVDASSRGGVPLQFGISPPSNRKLIFEPGATLQAITNSLDSYRVLSISGVTNVEIVGGIISGDKDDHTGVTGEAGHAIYITNGNDIRISNAQGNNGWGVGIAIFVANNVWIDNCTFDNNRQNGGALISGEDIWFTNCEFKNTSGTAPAAGFDIEPNNNTHVFENINFINCKTSNNEGVGFSVALATLKEGTGEIAINIDNLVDDGSSYGLYVNKLFESTTTTGPKGEITIRNPKLYNSQQGGIYIQNYESVNTPHITIDSPFILNCNTDESTFGQFVSGIIALRSSAEDGTSTMGNFTIKNPIVIDDRAVPVMPYAIYMQDEKLVYFDNALIVDPLELSGTTISGINYLFFSNPGVSLIDSHNIISATVNSTTSLITRMYTQFFTTPLGVAVNFNAATGLTDNSITFVSQNSSGLTITPDAAYRLRPLSSTGGQAITTTENGASITLRLVDSASYRVENQVGTWTLVP